MPDITLYQFPTFPGQDSGSPFCTKVHRILAMKGLDYTPEAVGGPGELKRLNPGVGKVPVLRYDGELVRDSSRIAAFLDERHPDPPLWPADPEQRALCHVLEDWADESLYWFAVYHRWAIDANFRPFAAVAFGKLPPPVRWIVPVVARRQALQQLHGQGIGRLPVKQVGEILGGHLAALETYLGGRPFVTGEACTVADIAIFAVFQALALPALPETAALVRRRPALVDWAQRVDVLTAGLHTAAFGA